MSALKVRVTPCPFDDMLILLLETSHWFNSDAVEAVTLNTFSSVEPVDLSLAITRSQ